MFVGGAVGALIVIVIFAVLFVSPPESIKPEIVVSNGHSSSTVGEITPLMDRERGNRARVGFLTTPPRSIGVQFTANLGN